MATVDSDGGGGAGYETEGLLDPSSALAAEAGRAGGRHLTVRSPGAPGNWSRHWTTVDETSGGGHVMSNTTAFLLRPVSSSSGGGRRVSGGGGGSRVRNVSAKDVVYFRSSPSVHVHSTAAAPSSRQAPESSAGIGRQPLDSRQPTCESAPSPSLTGNMPQLPLSTGGAPTHARMICYLPRQHSDAGPYGLKAAPDCVPGGGPFGTGGGDISPRQLLAPFKAGRGRASPMRQSQSHLGITLVRGTSCSLVDIPTYLGPSLSRGGGVELAKVCDATGTITVPAQPLIPPKSTSAAAAATVGSRPANSSTRSRKSDCGQLQQPRQSTHPQQVQAVADPEARLAFDQQLNRQKKKAAKSTRKAKWTVLCVSLLLLTMCVTLVGTMLSVGSQYSQQKIIANSHNWTEINKNKKDKINNNKNIFSKNGHMGTTTVSPFEPSVPRAIQPTKSVNEFYKSYLRSPHFGRTS